VSGIEVGGFWDGRSGHILRWIAVPIAAVAGALVGYLLGYVNSFLVHDMLPIPGGWQPAFTGILQDYFSPMLWVLAPAWVAPKGSKYVAIIFGTIIAVSIAGAALAGPLGLTSAGLSGLDLVLWVVLGALGTATGMALGFAIAKDRKE